MMKCRPVLVFLLLLGVNVAAYAPVWNSFFLSDDFNLVAAVRDGGPFGIWSSRPTDFFRPLTSCVVYLDYHLWKLDPRGFHTTNVLFHTLSAFFVYCIALRLLAHLAHGGRSPSSAVVTAQALACALLFSTLPSHTESVAWIAGRTDLIAVAFGLGCFYCALLYLDKGRPLHAVLSVGLLCAGLLSKEAVVLLPAAVAIFGVVGLCGGGGRQSLRRAICLTSLLVVCAVAYISIRAAVVGSLVGGYGSAVHLRFAPADMMINAYSNLFRVFGSGEINRHVALQCGLYSDPRLLRGLVTLLSLPPLVALGIVLFRNWPSRRAACCAVLGLLLSALLLMAPILNMRVSFFTSSGERFLYLASAFCALALLLVVRLTIGGKATAAVLLLAALLQVGVLRQALAPWQHAGQISAAVVKDAVCAAPREGEWLVLNLPDNLRGAYILRNGFPAALSLFGASVGPDAVVVPLGHTLDRATLALTARRLGPGSFEVELPAGQSVFTDEPLPPAWRHRITVAKPSPHRRQISLGAASRLSRVSYYSEGRLRTLE